MRVSKGIGRYAPTIKIKYSKKKSRKIKKSLKKVCFFCKKYLNLYVMMKII